MARRRRRRAGELTPAKTILAILVLVGVGCVLTGGAVVYYRQVAAVNEIDKVTMCPKSGPLAITSVLLDRTDRINDLQAEFMQKTITEFADAVPVGGRLNVYEVGVGGALVSPLVSVCNPESGSDANALVANKKRLLEKYRQKFVAPIDSVITNMKSDAVAKTSPIMEAIQAISVRDFGDTGPANGRDLVVFSDLLQNSDNVNVYKSVPNKDTFEASSGGRALHTDLTSVQAHIFIINRKGEEKRQTDELGAFWLFWLDRQGATLAEQRHVPG